jgi:adenylate kinase
VGKGTYATRVAEAFGLRHVAAGDLVREEMKRATPLGREMAAAVDAGELLPDAMILAVLRECFAAEGAGGAGRFLLDGFPRTAAQAAALEGVADVALALNLSLREEVLVEKCLGRRMCSHCGGNYNVADIQLPAAGGRPAIVMPPLAAPAECAPHLERRSDDNEATVLRRLELYRREAGPVEAFYRARGLLEDFEITGGIPETLPRLMRCLERHADAAAPAAASA